MACIRGDDAMSGATFKNCWVGEEVAGFARWSGEGTRPHVSVAAVSRGAGVSRDLRH